jgi:hypothetical protein
MRLNGSFSFFVLRRIIEQKSLAILIKKERVDGNYFCHFTERSVVIIMLDKIKELPEKFAFITGLTLILVSPFFLFLLAELFLFNNSTSMIIQGIVYAVATLFILSAADKKHSRIDEKE